MLSDPSFATLSIVEHDVYFWLFASWAILLTVVPLPKSVIAVLFQAVSHSTQVLITYDLLR